MAYRYRDSKTGYFASEATYNRSASHGGSRYIREEVETEQQKEEGPIATLEDFYDAYDDADFYDYEEYESSADYKTQGE